MSDKYESVISFNIDNTPTAKQTSKEHNEDYELKFSDFLDQKKENIKDKFTYSNKAVQKAGRKLRKKEGDIKSATAIIQTFRAAHEMPLDTIAYLVGRCCRELEISIQLVTRLKRLDTIINKLQRKSLDGKTDNATCVTNMSDIGGCRAIFSDIKSLNKIKEKLQAAIATDTRVMIKDINAALPAEHKKVYF